LWRARGGRAAHDGERMDFNGDGDVDIRAHTPTDARADVVPTGSTREGILDAALAILGRDGFQALTTRAIAEEAGVNQALINYHFGTKDKLILELSDVLNTGKYARQRTMYYEPGVPLSAKWRQAVAFYRLDLADGWDRVVVELYAAGFANPAIASRAMARLQVWKDLLEEVAAQYLPALGITLPPHVVVNVVVNYWIGMSTRIIDGPAEQTEAHFAILDAIGDWLEARERQLADGADADLAPLPPWPRSPDVP
jgi:AcrR family transcriptional regulator